MYERHEIGRIGEEIAQRYVQQLGYKIIECNFECKQGEIDIIAKDKEELVFIEVKTRTNEKYGKPKEAVNQIKKKHIYKSAEFYLYFKHIKNIAVRIDVIQVYIKNGKSYINYIKNAIIERPKR